MKKITSKLSFALLAIGITLSAITISSCSKSSGGPSGPTAPTNPGGYTSSSQIQPSALVSYWAFNGNFTDSAGGLVTTNNGATFSPGMLTGTQSFQGSSTGYADITNPGTKLPAMQSFTASVWINSAQITPASNEIAFFQLINNTEWQSNIHLGLIQYSATSDSLKMGIKLQNFPNGQTIAYGTYYLNAFLDTAVNKWTHVVVTYSGATSTVAVYQNGLQINVEGPYTPPAGFQGLELFQTDPGTPVPTGASPNSNPNGAALWGNLTFEDATAVTFGTWGTNTTPPLGAGGPNSWAGNYLGQMQHLRIYNTALSASDVASLYILERGGF
jgi:hypothetical protein